MAFPTLTYPPTNGVTVNTLPAAGQNVAGESLSVIPAAVAPAVVTAGTTFNALSYGDVEFQFTTGTVSVTRSLDGVNYVAWPVINGADTGGLLVTSATTPSIWSVDGGAYLKFSADVTVRGAC